MLKANGFARNRIITPACLTAVVLAVALASCAHTKFASTWRDPAYQGQPKTVLVHAVGRDPTVTTIFENQLVAQLGKHGVAALAGHEFLPNTLAVNREVVKRVVAEKGVDAVFIAGPTTRKDLESLRPGEISYASGLYEGQAQDYEKLSSFVNRYSTGSSYAGAEVDVEMVLYDVKTEKRIWSALSKSYIWDSAVDEIEPTVNGIVKKLVAEKIIP